MDFIGTILALLLLWGDSVIQRRQREEVDKFGDAGGCDWGQLEKGECGWGMECILNENEGRHVAIYKSIQKIKLLDT